VRCVSFVVVVVLAVIVVGGGGGGLCVEGRGRGGKGQMKREVQREKRKE